MKTEPLKAEVGNFKIDNEGTLKILYNRNCIIRASPDKTYVSKLVIFTYICFLYDSMLIIVDREILVVKVATSGLSGHKKSIIPSDLQAGLKRGVY